MKYVDSSVANEYLAICRGIAKAKFEDEEIQLKALHTVLYHFWNEYGIHAYRELQDIIYKEFNLL